MLKEITKLILGIIIVGGAVYSVFVNGAASQILLPLAGIIVGYYFKDVTGGLGRILGK
jgi:hypothetical protein